MSIPTQADILAAAERLAPHLGQPTPLFRSAALSELLDADIWLKVETTGPIASFKLRGALNALLTATAKPTAAVTASTGNHGQGVAYAARLLGIPADIFVPEGCAHGYLALEDATEVTYTVTRPYHPQAERGLRWNDATFGISWPDTGTLILSDKDRQWPDYSR